MKRFPKLIVTLLVLAMVIGIFTAIPVAAANDYEALRLKVSHLTAGHYTTTAMDGEIVQHSANKDYKEEIGCMIDNDNSGAYWSKPYKFNELRDNGGSITPVVLIDVAAFGNGSPVAVAGFDLRLRSAFDCRPLHVVLQATTEDGSNNWKTLADKKFTDADWEASPKQRIEFPETTVYKFRLLAYDIGDVNPAKDDYKDYVVCKGDETRLALSEIDLLKYKEGGSASGNGGSTTKPTTGGSQGATRPGGISIPTRPAPTTATQAPTTATQAPTQKPTTSGGQTATQAPTQKPTTSQGATVAPTTATVAPTTPTGTVDPSAPTDPTGTVDPSAPTDPTGTVDPSAPTVDPSEPVVDPEYLTYEIVDEGAVITAVDAAALTGTVSIPQTLGGYPVTAIGDAAFEGVELTEVIFAGTEAQWQQITVGTGNDVLTTATVTYQGEPTPTEPTTEPTVAPTVESTEPEGTTPTDVNDGEEEPKDFPWIIVVIIAAAAVVAGGAVFFIIKKKKQG